MSVNTSAGALGAIKRLSFLNKTLPLAALLAEELSEKLAPLTIGWDNLADQSVDIQLRGRAAAAVGALVTDKATLLKFGWSANGPGRERRNRKRQWERNGIAKRYQYSNF